MNAPTTSAPGTALVASLATEGGAMTVAQLKANRELMKQAMADLMEPGKHYGKIPGTQKPTLYKPGAELLFVLFRVHGEPVVEDLSDNDCIRYRVKMKAVHIPSGQIIGWGVGECSTDEDKYKWREAKCKAEFLEAEEDRRRWKWKGDGEDNGVNQVRTNPADAANTILKMAEKRAKIDAALSFTGASDVFNQDLEDIAEWLRDKAAADQGEEGEQPTGKSGTRPPQKRVTPAAGSGQDPNKPINANQLDVLKSYIDRSGVGENDLLKLYGNGAARLEDLPYARLNDAIAYCRKATEPPQ